MPKDRNDTPIVPRAPLTPRISDPREENTDPPTAMSAIEKLEAAITLQREDTNRKYDALLRAIGGVRNDLRDVRGEVREQAKAGIEFRSNFGRKLSETSDDWTREAEMLKLVQEAHKATVGGIELRLDQVETAVKASIAAAMSMPPQLAQITTATAPLKDKITKSNRTNWRLSIGLALLTAMSGIAQAWIAAKRDAPQPQKTEERPAPLPIH